MNTILHLITVAGFLVMVWYVRLFLRETISYKEVRSQEMKRRLQVEAKNELDVKAQLENADDDEALKIRIKAMDQRHQRSVGYIIQDMFDRQQ